MKTEARWHIGMSSASNWDDPGSNPGKGENFSMQLSNWLNSNLNGAMQLVVDHGAGNTEYVQDNNNKKYAYAI